MIELYHQLLKKYIILPKTSYQILPLHNLQYSPIFVNFINMIRKISIAAGLLTSALVNKDCSAAENDPQFSRNAACLL